MRAITLLCFLLVIFPSRNAQAQTLGCEWAKSVGPTGITSGRCVAADPSGNSFLTGTFTAPTLTIGATTLTNAGITNIYLAKYDGAGNVLWAKSAHGTNDDNVYQVAADHSGNSIITGYTESTTFVIGTDTLIHSGSGFQHAIVAKFDPSGNLLWAHAPDQGNAAGMAVAVDPSDNIFVTGLFNGGYIVFGADTLIDTSNNTFGVIFLVKYNSAGSVQWALTATGADPDYFSSISTDPYGNAYVTGRVMSPVVTIGSYVLNNPGGARVRTAKISPAGDVIWARLASSGTGTAITTDQAGNPYITGFFVGDSIVFGSVTLHDYAYGDTFLNSAMFVVKYDTAGNAVWGKEAGFSSPAYEAVRGTTLVTDNQNNLYVAGNFHGDSDLIYGADTLHNDTGNHGSNLLLAAYDGSGNLLWAKNPAGNGAYAAASVTTNNSGDLFMCGVYQYGAINFGATSLPVGDTTSAFIVKIAAPSRTSVKELSSGNNLINAFPVPAANLLNVGLTGSGYTSLKIIDLAGRQVWARTCNPATDNLTVAIDISALPAGAFLLQAVKHGSEISRKVIVER